jgi:hypothetical protein
LPPSADHRPDAGGQDTSNAQVPVIIFSTRVRHLVAAGWIAVILSAGVVLASVFVSPAIPFRVRAVVAAFSVLALARPADALLVTAAFIAFNGILAALAGVPGLRATEILVVAPLFGCSVRALLGPAPYRSALRQSISAPVLLFSVAAVASMLVWLRVDQVRTGSTSAYLSDLFRFLSHRYFSESSFPMVVSTAAVLEGLALYAVAGALCRSRPQFVDQALRMLAVGGAGLAFMSVVRLGEITLRNPRIIETMRSTYAGLRISPQIPDYIAAGAYFVLCWLVALGVALASRRRVAWLIAGIPLLLGLYLEGSRSPIFAAIVGIAVMLISVLRRRNTAVRAVGLFAVLALIVIVFSFRHIVGHDIAGETAWQSVIVRYELTRTGLRVMATRPLFGVGIDRFFVPAEDLATPRLKSMWQARKNPHNDFLRVGAELGLIGLGLFVWMLGRAFVRICGALRNTGDVRLAGVAGGLTAFLITSLTSNPLMVRDVSYAFWIALGVAEGRSASLATVAETKTNEFSASMYGSSGIRWAAGFLLAACLLVSVPFRAEQELASIDPARVSYGLSDWATDSDGTRYRISGPRATVYVDGRARLLDIPLRGTLPSGALQRVEILIDGRRANAFAIGADWQRFRALVPDAPTTGSHRIDFLVSPCWVPAEVVRGSDDRRVLGAQIGEIKTRRF